MNSLPCTAVTHAATVADTAFTALPIVGYQQLPATVDEPADIVELRRCPQCGSTLGRELHISVRLATARRDGDMGMIGRCLRALRPDPFTDRIDDSAIRSWVEAVEFEELMRRRVTVAGVR